jgi:hypothetical protein
MRKFILITAMVLASATAQAGVTRGLTLASNDEPAAVEQAKETAKETVKETVKEAPKSVEAPNATEATKFVDRPAPVTTTTETPNADSAKAVADKNPQAPKVEKPKRRRESTEARVIYELHRHGIYW